MGAAGAGAIASIVGIVIFAIILGAINGSVFWTIRNGLFIGTVTSIVMQFLLTAVGFSSAGVMIWSLPSLAFAFLVSYTVAVKVKINTKLNAIWSSVIACFLTLIASVPYILTFRVSIFAPIIFAVIAGLVIFKPALEARKWLHQLINGVR